jgi:hypothetical protein
MEAVWAQERKSSPPKGPRAEPVKTKFSTVNGSFDIKWLPSDTFLEREYLFTFSFTVKHCHFAPHSR